MATNQDLFDKITAARMTFKLNPYLVAVFSVLITLVFRWLFGALLLESAPFLLFIIPILLSAWYGGFWPGMTSTILSIIFGGYFFQDGQNIETFIFRMVIFFGEGLLISLLSEERNKSEKERDKTLIAEKLARRNAEQQARIREHFITVAAHELKTPITSQKGYLQILKNLVQKNQHLIYESYINKIESQSDKLTNFINDLLDVSKMNSRELQYHFEHISMKDLVIESIEHIENLLVIHKVVLKGRGVKQVFVDKDRMSQVMTNLLSNAIKYSPESKKIIVTISETKKSVTVGVQDFGIGIDPENRQKIFNRFFRVSGNDETSFKGLGLGLYLTAQIIKKHKGQIWVESTKGKGSTFFFSIPTTP